MKSALFIGFSTTGFSQTSNYNTTHTIGKVTYVNSDGTTGKIEKTDGQVIDFFEPKLSEKGIIVGDEVQFHVVISPDGYPIGTDLEKTDTQSGNWQGFSN